MRVQKLSIGKEGAPLWIIDDFIANPDDLVALAARQTFAGTTRYFPGIRAPAPLSYQKMLIHFFGGRARLSMCHYSLITTPPQELAAIQRIPHIDSTDPNGFATIHYLFKQSWDGTAFYRHRKTGFESIDASRAPAYFSSLEAENNGPDMPGPAYINGDTPLFEQICKQDGVYNRMLVYRRNSLHSGCIGPDFVPDPNPLTGRLSINSFIDLDQ
jgi:hypothetical protein